MAGVKSQQKKEVNFFIHMDRLYFTTAKETQVNVPMLLKMHGLSSGADILSY